MSSAGLHENLWIDFAQSETGPQKLTFSLKGCSVQLKLNSKNTVKTKQFCNNSLKKGYFFPVSLYKAQAAVHNVVMLSKRVCLWIFSMY